MALDGKPINAYTTSVCCPESSTNTTSTVFSSQRRTPTSTCRTTEVRLRPAARRAVGLPPKQIIRMSGFAIAPRERSVDARESASAKSRSRFPAGRGAPDINFELAHRESTRHRRCQRRGKSTFISSACGRPPTPQTRRHRVESTPVSFDVRSAGAPTGSPAIYQMLTINPPEMTELVQRVPGPGAPPYPFLVTESPPHGGSGGFCELSAGS